MTEPDKNSKIIEVSGPNIIKESEPKNIEEIEKNDLPDNLNDLQILSENDKNENNPLNIINMEQKEKSYKDEITQKNEFEENKIPNNINEEKEQNIELTSNNNLSKILNTNNIDIANLVKSQSYLTSLPITNNRNKKQIQLTSANRKTYNYLKEKENSLCLEINAIKQKRSQLNSYSFEKLGGKNIIENNIRETELKKLKQKENNLLEKLENIKVQISDLINNEKKLNLKNNIKEFLEKLNNNETTKNIIKKTKSIEAESNIYRQKHMLDLEKAKNKKINEINKKEEELMNNKIKNLRAQRQREIELMRKRKKQIDEKIEKTKKYIQNKPIFHQKNYLYNKLANQFEGNGKISLNQQKIYRKSKLSGGRK